MRLCTALDKPCSLPDSWEPFAPDRDVPVLVDWLGARTFWVSAQLRARDGNPIPLLAEHNPERQDILQVSLAIVGRLDETIPLTQLPVAVQTAVSATQMAFPVKGSLSIPQPETGGPVGQSVSIQVSFQATSPDGPVTDLRLTGGCPKTAAEMDASGASWEPFVSTRTFQVGIGQRNWTVWGIAVQYRDVQGNLSPVYCATATVEGLPAPASP